MKNRNNYDWSKAYRHCYKATLSKEAMDEIQNLIPNNLLESLSYLEIGQVLQIALMLAEMGYREGRDKERLRQLMSISEQAVQIGMQARPSK